MKTLLPLLLSALIHSTLSAQNVVIHEIYGGGGISGAVYRNDFVELYNNSTVVVNLSGWSIQYASAAGSGWSAVPLTGEMAPHGYFLVQLASSGTIGQPLPAPDVTGTINMNASTGGKIALVSVPTALAASTCPVDTHILDLVGYGNASCFSGSAAAPNPSATRSISRTAGVNSHDNAADFTAGTPTPKNSGRLDVTINFDPVAQKTFGDPSFSLSATASLELPVGFTIDNPAVATIDGNLVSIHGAGTATITAALFSTYFVAPPQTQILTVQKAPLSVTAQDITILAGDPIPGFTTIYVGLLGGDDFSALDSPPFATTTASSTSPAGNYPISLSTGTDANYEITTHPGVLTIINPPVLPAVNVINPVDGASALATNLNVTSKLLTGATTYTIQLSASPLFQTDIKEKSGGRTQNFTGLSFATRYYARVKTNLSPLLGKITSFTTGPPEQFTYVASPANHALHVGITPNITSNLISGATVYTIELNTTSDFSGTSQIKSGTRTLAFSNLSFSTLYYARVKTNLSDTWGPTRSFSTGSATVLGFVTSPGNNAINVSWLPTLVMNNLNASSYTVQISPAQNFEESVVELTSPTNKTMVTTPLAYHTRYFVRVRTNLSQHECQSVCDSDLITCLAQAGGNPLSEQDCRDQHLTCYSQCANAWGPVRSFITGNPENYAFVTAPANGTTNINLGFNVSANLVPGATSYTIELNSDQNFDVNSKIEKTSTTRTINFQLLPDTKYYSRVKTNLSGEVWGAIRSFTTGNAITLAYVISPVNLASNVNLITTVSANSIPGVTSYTIELNSSPDFTGASQVKTSAKPGISFSLNENQTYFSRVKTNLDNGWGNTVKSFTTGTATSLAFVASPKNGGTGVPTTVKVYSNPVGSATQYTIELNPTADFSGPGFTLSSGSRVINFSGLQISTPYFTRVQTNLAPGQWGPVKMFTTLNPNPAGRMNGITDDWEGDQTVLEDEPVNDPAIQWLDGLKVMAYPNPFYHSFTLKSEEEISLQFMVHDASGRIIQQGDLWPRQSIDLGGDWTEQLYLLKVYHGTRVTSFKLLKGGKAIRD